MYNPLLKMLQIGSVPTKIENVFGTFLSTGTGAPLDIVTDINLAISEGMVWGKSRDQAKTHVLTDTLRGVGETLTTASDAIEVTNPDTITAFSDDRFTVGADILVNTNLEDYVFWVFRKAAKFFDILEWDGDDTVNRLKSHELKSIPGLMMVKDRDTVSPTGLWFCKHIEQSTADRGVGIVDASTTYQDVFGTIDHTANDISLDATYTNAVGSRYIAYLFAHDPTSTGIIYCASFVTDGSGESSVTIGWEPQWLLMFAPNLSGGWQMVDTERGFVAGADNKLKADTTGAEVPVITAEPTSTGFEVSNGLLSKTYYYMAIRKPI